jgi:hypothetical protein
MVMEQYMHVDGYAADIVNARLLGAPSTSIEARAALWANRHNEAYNEANIIIATEYGGKLVWKLGKTEQHCETCAALDGVVDYAAEWERTGLHPQGAENPLLECGGWLCDCTLTPTDDRKTRGGLQGMGY